MDKITWIETPRTTTSWQGGIGDWYLSFIEKDSNNSNQPFKIYKDRAMPCRLPLGETETIEDAKAIGEAEIKRIFECIKDQEIEWICLGSGRIGNQKSFKKWLRGQVSTQEKVTMIEGYYTFFAAYILDDGSCDLEIRGHGDEECTTIPFKDFTSAQYYAQLRLNSLVASYFS